MASRTCEICGKKLGTDIGLIRHKNAVHGIPFPDKTLKQAGPNLSISDNEKILTIPCSLGGNAFNVEVCVKITATRITSK